MTSPPRLALAVVAILGIAFIGMLALTGTPPGADFGHYQSHGIVAAEPSSIVRIEVTQGKERRTFSRTASGGWAFDPPGPTRVPDELASHLEAGLRFMNVSAPARTLDPAETNGASFAVFDLDPPAYVVSLATADHTAAVADFGTLNPSGTSQYVRLIGQPTLYLMPRHVGAEWSLAFDMAKRLAPGTGSPSASGAAAGLLLPVSLDQIWAVEIVYGGTLHRFERDGAGSWLLHVGQHSHGSGTLHVADPAKAKIIAATLEAFEQTRIEASVGREASGVDLERYGLDRPPILALLYARDNSTPLARIEIGRVADDGFGRYARLAKGGGVVKIAAYEADRLIGLLKAVGAAS